MALKYYTAQEMNKGVSRKDLGKKNFRKQCKGCFDFIEELCKSANMDMMTAFLAITMFQRFAVQQSIMLTDRYLVAAAALFLAAKVTEKPRSLAYFVSKLVKKRLKPEEARAILTPNPDGQCTHPVYKQVQENLLLLEHQMLCLTGFDVLNTPSPYTCTPGMWAKIPFLVDLESREKADQLVKPPHIGSKFSVRQIAYNCVNDSLRMGLCIQYTAEDISLACIDAMLTLLNLPTRSNDKPWWAGSEWDTGEARTTLITSIREEIIKWYVVPGRPAASAAASAATRNKTEAVTAATDAITATDNVGLGGEASGGVSAGGGAAQSTGPVVVGAKRARPEEVEQGVMDAPAGPPEKMAKHSVQEGVHKEGCGGGDRHDHHHQGGGGGGHGQLSPDDLTVYPDTTRGNITTTATNGVSHHQEQHEQHGGGGDGGDVVMGNGDDVAPVTAQPVAAQPAAAQPAAQPAAGEDDRESGELEAGEIPQ